ncbi:hypothetical protein ACFL2H_12365 [Planctomycetota bacterium]
MQNHEGKRRKRWRFRFSTKTLLVFVAVAAIYFGLSEATKKWGVLDLKSHYEQQGILVESHAIRVRVPLVVEVEQLVPAYNTSDPLAGSRHGFMAVRRYHFWFFGYIVAITEEA